MAVKRCPRCDTHEPDPRTGNCRNCGELLVDLLKAVQCPECGAPSGRLDECGLCGAKLLIGPPLEECFPEKPYSAGIRPVILLRESRPAPDGPRAGPPLPAGEDGEAPGTLARLRGLQLTTDSDQMEGIPKDHVRLEVGETVTIYARGQEEGGKWCALPPDLVLRWRADRELELRPGTGHVVTVKLLSAPRVSALATARTAVGRKKLQRIFTVEKR